MVVNAESFLNPVSSEISDLRNFWLYALYACTKYYSKYLIRWENWWSGFRNFRHVCLVRIWVGVKKEN